METADLSDDQDLVLELYRERIDIAGKREILNKRQEKRNGQQLKINQKRHKLDQEERALEQEAACDKETRLHLNTKDRALEQKLEELAQRKKQKKKRQQQQERQQREDVRRARARP